MKLSVIILTLNEEDYIEDCIESVSFADEIIVIDSGSADKTLQKAKAKDAKVYTIPFKDFASQRNEGLSKAKGEWVLYLDADERVSKLLEQEIKRSININNNISAYKIQRKNYYFGKHEWPNIENHVRLFRKKSLIRWTGKIHESPQYAGPVGTLDGYIFHYTHENLSSMVDKTNQWSEYEAQLLYDADHPPMNILRFAKVMSSKFFDSYIKQSGWKAGKIGIIESMYQAYSYFIVYSKLWEKQLTRDKKNERSNITHKE
jgi:glycosyltransferase involved in cell wall biosynthesis